MRVVQIVAAACMVGLGGYYFVRRHWLAEYWHHAVPRAPRCATSASTMIVIGTLFALVGAALFVAGIAA